LYINIENPRDKIILLILIETGCNISELSKIKIAHIDIKKKTLRIPKRNTKNHIPRKIKLSKELSAKIFEYAGNKKNNEYLFNSRQSEIISPRRIEQILQKYSISSGKRLIPRDIRNSYLKSCISKNITRDDIMKMTGLKNLKKIQIVDLKKIGKIRFENSRDEIIFKIFCETGLRLSELTRLNVSDFQKTSLIIGDDKRKIRISKELSEKIKLYTIDAKKGNFLINRKRKKISDRRIQQIFKHYSSIYFFRITPRIIRNSFIIEMDKKGFSIDKIKKMLAIDSINLFTHGIAK